MSQGLSFYSGLAVLQNSMQQTCESVKANVLNLRFEITG